MLMLAIEVWRWRSGEVLGLFLMLRGWVLRLVTRMRMLGERRRSEIGDRSGRRGVEVGLRLKGQVGEERDGIGAEAGWRMVG
jgi:hypothetical protein